jgi:hypothetical protein
VVAGVTSNLKMKGIPLSKSEGALKESVIKLNYIFTIAEEMVSKVVFHLSKEKRSWFLMNSPRNFAGSKHSSDLHPLKSRQPHHSNSYFGKAHAPFFGKRCRRPSPPCLLGLQKKERVHPTGKLADRLRHVNQELTGKKVECFYFRFDLLKLAG